MKNSFRQTSGRPDGLLLLLPYSRTSLRPSISNQPFHNLHPLLSNAFFTFLSRLFGPTARHVGIFSGCSIHRWCDIDGSEDFSASASFSSFSRLSTCNFFIHDARELARLDSHLEDGFMHVEQVVEIFFRFNPLSRFVKNLSGVLRSYQK